MKTTFGNDLDGLLDEVTKSYLGDETTLNQVYKLSEITDSPDLVLMDVDESENYLLGMWNGVQGYRRELTIIDGHEVKDE